MKKIISLLLLILTSCATPQYKIGDRLYVGTTPVTVVKVYTFIGSGYCDGALYTVRYMLTTGEFKEKSFCERDLTSKSR